MDHSSSSDFSGPEHLAWDEALLEGAEAGELGEVLRFWESSSKFVVLGAGGRASVEVDLAAAGQRGLPVLRRCSGGGTVLQGPGCLNYVFVLDSHSRAECRTVDGTTALALRWVSSALERQGIRATVEGVSDLALGVHKFSGNAQRRKRRFMLFHGTLLYRFALGEVGDVLRDPPRQPDWRAKRSHEAFITNLPESFSRTQLMADLTNDLGIEETVSSEQLRQRVDRLLEDKYLREDWHLSL